MKAHEFLQSSEAILRERGATYDKQGNNEERSMAKVVVAFNALTGRDLTETEGWQFMLILKMVRQLQSSSYHHDSALDALSYAALYAESLYKEATNDKA